MMPYSMVSGMISIASFMSVASGMASKQKHTLSGQSVGGGGIAMCPGSLSFLSETPVTKPEAKIG